MQGIASTSGQFLNVLRQEKQAILLSLSQTMQKLETSLVTEKLNGGSQKSTFDKTS